MDWTDKAIETLGALWAEGLSVLAIGKRMGISKNAVVGKAHRLKLPPRPSPIRRAGAPPLPRKPRPAGKVTLPALASVAAPPAVVVTPAAAAICRAAAPPPPAPPPPVVYRAAPFRHVVDCSWPIGEPGRAGFRWCDAVAVAGKPYCFDHCAVAYVQSRGQREDAA